MVKLYRALLLVGLIYACRPNKEKEPAETPVHKTGFSEIHSLRADTVSVMTTDTVCDCVYENLNWQSIQKDVFSIYTNVEDSVFQKYAHDSVRNKINALYVNSDSVPAKYRIFRNVRLVYITGRGAPVGLTHFPKLKYLVSFGSFDFNIVKESAWLKNIEAIMMGKCFVQSFTSFKLTPKLKYLNIGHSSFDTFPTDLENAPCLQEIYINAFGSISGGKPVDLIKYDLLMAPCLRNFHFDTYYGAFKGLPKNVLKSKVKEFYVYSKLNDVEKAEYEEIKKVKRVRR